MKWFKRWFAKKCREAWEEANADNSVPTPKGARLVSTADADSDEGLNISVRQAIGGRIVSFRHYDRQRDRGYSKTYIIPEDLDFERELGKMITMESMR